MSNKTKVFIMFLFLLIFFLGYVRETIFIIVNSVLYNYPFPFNSSYIVPPKFLYDYSTQSLINIKWLLTLLFSLVFMLLSVVIFKFYFKNKIIIRYTYILYALLVAVSFLFFLIGYLVNYVAIGYPIARFFMGFAQSPLTTLVLFVIFYFRNNHNSLIKD